MTSSVPAFLKDDKSRRVIPTIERGEVFRQRFRLGIRLPRATMALARLIEPRWTIKTRYEIY